MTTPPPDTTPPPEPVPASRSYPAAPAVGVGAIVWRDRRILLIRRARPPQAGQWSIPGGRQEVGETLFEAAAREVREETGIEVVPTGIVTAVDSIHRDAEGRAEWHYTIVDVAAEWIAGEPVAGDDAADARWATLDEAEALIGWPELRRVIRLSAEQRRGHAGGRPMLKARPDVGRILRSRLGGFIARPWLDAVSIALFRDWWFPMSRAWAAAEAADGDLESFARGIGVEPAALARSGSAPRILADVAALRHRYRIAVEDWRMLMASSASPLPEAVAAEEARLDAAHDLSAARFRFTIFARSWRVPGCRWAIPTVAEVEARHGARRASPETAYALDFELEQAVGRVVPTRRLPGPWGDEYWIEFGPLTRWTDTRCRARVWEPAQGAADAPTVIILHGIGIETDQMRVPIAEIERLVRRGLRVVAPEAPWHSSRRPDGWYGGEPFVATTPLGPLDFFAAAVPEVAVVTAWSRRTGRGPVGLVGHSLGALTAQLAATHGRAWPAAAQADAMVLFTTAEGIERVGFDSTLAQAFGLDRQLTRRGWTVETLAPWSALTDPLGAPSMGADRVVVVLGQRDDVTPFDAGMAIAQRWGIEADRLFVRPEQGHFSVPAGLVVDETPVDVFVRVLSEAAG